MEYGIENGMHLLDYKQVNYVAMPINYPEVNDFVPWLYQSDQSGCSIGPLRLWKLHDIYMIMPTRHPLNETV